MEWGEGGRLCVQCLASTHLEKAAVASHRPFWWGGILLSADGKLIYRLHIITVWPLLTGQERQWKRSARICCCVQNAERKVYNCLLLCEESPGKRCTVFCCCIQKAKERCTSVCCCVQTAKERCTSVCCCVQKAKERCTSVCCCVQKAEGKGVQVSVAVCRKPRENDVQVSVAVCRKLREKVYETLEVWLQVTGSLCGCSNNVSTLNDLLAEVYFDISQQQPQALQVPSQVQSVLLALSVLLKIYAPFWQLCALMQTAFYTVHSICQH